MRKESRSQTRSVIAKQQTQMRSADTVVTARKRSGKVSTSTPVIYGTPSRDTKSVSKSRSAALSGSSLSPGRSREVKQTSAADVSSYETAVLSAVIQQQPGANVSGSIQDRVSSARTEKTACKTPDRSSQKSRRWVKGGPIEYSTPPSDNSNDKTGIESVADKQKYSVDSCESTKGKSSSKRNIALTFGGSDKEAGVKQRCRDSDSLSSTVAGGKRKKISTQQGSTAESKSSSAPKGRSQKSSKSSVSVKVEEDAPRTKRMARLNAEAIVSLIYKHDEPAARSSRFCDSDDSDIDTDSSEFSSEDERSVVAPEKIRAETSPSREDSTGTCKKEGDDADRSPTKKRGVQSSAKQSSSKSNKSPKSQPKASSKRCKRKPVEAVLSPGWSPPKRMASLNAQVCFHTFWLLI